MKIVVISPYPTVRMGLRASLEHSEDGPITVVAEYVSPGDLVEAEIPAHDGVLVEGVSASVVRLLLRQRDIYSAVVSLGEEESEWREIALREPGGLLPREATTEQIASALRAASSGLTVYDSAIIQESSQTFRRSDDVAEHANDRLLTAREVQVLQLMADGLPNKTIALRLGISDHTVKFHVSSLLAKLEASSRTEAVSNAARRGLLIL